MRRKVVCVVGTRPEAIKMAPLVHRLRRPDTGLDVRLIGTGQHRELLDQALADFNLVVDRDLGLMRPGQSLAQATASALEAITQALEFERPDLVLAQGDTTTVFATALASEYLRIPFGHVEAGLRSGDRGAPFPEETNRVLATHLARLHFAPTGRARRNLLREGVPPGWIEVTGNTVIDALLITARDDLRLPIRLPTDRFALVTTHRRENWGEPLERICDALLTLVDRFPGLSVAWPVHPNPVVLQTVQRKLGGHARIALLAPLGYREFVALLKHSWVVLTDSGGVQEEAPALGKPVFVLRDVTERTEAGTVQLVGTRTESIVAAVEDFWSGATLAGRCAAAGTPYGDGWAAERIARAVAAWFGIDLGPKPSDLPPWPNPAAD